MPIDGDPSVKITNSLWEYCESRWICRLVGFRAGFSNAIFGLRVGFGVRGWPLAGSRHVGRILKPVGPLTRVSSRPRSALVTLGEAALFHARQCMAGVAFSPSFSRSRFVACIRLWKTVWHVCGCIDWSSWRNPAKARHRRGAACFLRPLIPLHLDAESPA